MFQELEHSTMKYQDIMQYCKEQHQIKLTKHNKKLKFAMKILHIVSKLSFTLFVMKSLSRINSAHLDQV
jgi:hypothetical protein